MDNNLDMGADGAPAAPQVSGRRAALVLVVVGIALMAVVSAVSGLNIAIPSLARETGASQAELTWIVDAYTVVFAGLLLFAGALGDRYGRKLLLIVGLIVFGASAAVAMVVTDPALLILARAGMGIGAAGTMPTTLSVITTSFPVHERPRAIGIWVGVAGGGAVIGLFGSGLLLEYFSWQSFFGLNVFLAAVALIGVIAVVPASTERDAPRLDWVGGALSLIAVASFVYGVIQGPEQGWTDPLTLLGLGLGIVAAVVFVLWELRVSQPMLDPRLFRLRGLSAGTLTITLQFFAAFGFFFAMIQFLQFINGRSPLETAIALLPLPIVLIPVARNAPHLAERIGFRRTAPVGLMLMAIGFGLLSQISADSDYLFFALGVVFFAAGMGLAGTPATTAITSALPRAKQGVASALNDVSRELGAALGIALLGSILNQAYRDGMADAIVGLPAQIGDRVLSSIAFVGSPEIAQLGPAGATLVARAQDAFVSGVNAAILTGSGLLVVAAIAVFVLAPAPETETAESRALAFAEAEAD